MSRTRRKFSSQFKADLCVELLKGEKDLNSLASENSLLPNLLRNWKKDFLEKCSKAFDDTSENYWKEKYLAEHREKEDYARKIGQLSFTTVRQYSSKAKVTGHVSLPRRCVNKDYANLPLIFQKRQVDCWKLVYRENVCAP